MQFRKLGVDGPEVSPLGLGGWALGGSLGRVSRAVAVHTIRHALERGVTLFDTAPAYGLSEEVFGEALAGRRDEVFLSTKVSPEDLLARDLFVASVERSLARLRTDRVDLLFVHRWAPGASLPEVCDWLARLIEAGSVRQAGFSDPSPAIVAGAAARLPVPPVVQWRYNIIHRESERDFFPLCAERGLGFLAFSPLNLGLLAGRFAADHQFPADDHRLLDADFRPPRFARLVEASARVAAIARRLGITPTALATAFVLARPEVSGCLIGAKTAEQVDLSLGALDVEITDDVRQEIDAIAADLDAQLAGDSAPAAAARSEPAHGGGGGRFAGKVVVITGGANSIGAETAVAFAREGASVVVADVDLLGARRTLERLFEVEPGESRARCIWCDLMKDEDVRRLFDRTVKDLGRIDILINNAGAAFYEGHDIERLGIAEWRRVLGINVRQTFVCTRFALPHMLARGRGVIVSTSSIYGIAGGCDFGYDAPKGGIPAFTRHLADAYAARGIRAACVAPGHVITRRNTGYHRDHDLTPAYPAGHLGSDLDIANAYLFLASDAARWINGATLPVDGGFLVR